jgi:hypothetical protein
MLTNRLELIDGPEELASAQGVSSLDRALEAEFVPFEARPDLAAAGLHDALPDAHRCPVLGSNLFPSPRGPSKETACPRELRPGSVIVCSQRNGGLEVLHGGVEVAVVEVVPAEFGIHLCGIPVPPGRRGLRRPCLGLTVFRGIAAPAQNQARERETTDGGRGPHSPEPIGSPAAVCDISFSPAPALPATLPPHASAPPT